ncbi:hypothetical protein DP067_01440 [Mycoplasmopsis anatis]|uniref:Hyaluronidase n=1 Tax=Mycoplasmopsis anatis 1340 TaxID=1034808 RepID=F9QCP3_9BACT|nr:beta-N-acetylglucosaminidase domain-containing protein [Mycoplasmopsis anatis]AWX70028.1 hypothetical protein DP067_01440 [Mycoplasmopsis anatis]EGS29460.1 hyaluronidase [Mycoplasmopsis anatis 1340]VEU73536.1 Hyaluronoglucosaminidase precursor [Mycoplasmopsis anatis]
MKKKNKALSIITIGSGIAGLSLGIVSANTNSKETQNKYEIYPNPHNISYDGSQSLITQSVNVVVEDGIDQDTITRLKETLKLQGITDINFTRRIDSDKTNFILGTKDNRDTFVDNYIKSQNITYQDGLMDKIDSYLLSIKNNVIAIYGNEVDSTFYGVTTLWHIFNQLQGHQIEDLKIEDYADVKTRGVVEGYYGNPWSVEDRINYMTWGGYYKLNAYFYAPKDDPKHNRNWAELYTNEEIERVIKPIAEAGNKSKVRFIYALHPFMHNRLDNGNVEDKKEKLKAKFLQVIKAGVRQIAILADDIGSAIAEDFQVKLLNEIVDWLKELKKTQYPDLKTTLPYVVREYGGWGQEYFKRFPQEVQIVMTGGKTWGEVSKNFTDSFKGKVGRSPMLWINWPCTDNSKNHLIMGGYKEFLHANVNPENIEGIILNPMQQSEPSKVAIFGAASYSWNKWSDRNDADKIWDDAFKHIDNKSAFDTPVSRAFRELSKHMINQKMDSRVVKLEESIELAPKLTALLNKLTEKSYTKDEVHGLVAEFAKLGDAANLFIEQANNKKLVEQIRPFLESWIDLTQAALFYLEILVKIKDEDINTINSLYTQAKAKLYSARNNHKFSYLSESKNAEVGAQHIQPFLTKLDNFTFEYLNEVLNKNKYTTTWTSNVFKNPSSGNLNGVFNLDKPQPIQFTNPNLVKKDDYIGAEFSKPIELNSVSIEMGTGRRHFFRSKLQYQLNGQTEWKDINGEVYFRPEGSIEPIEVGNLKIRNVKAVRLISTQNDGGTKWIDVNRFQINKPELKDLELAKPIKFNNVVLDKLQAVYGTQPKNAIDNAENIELYVKTDQQPKNDSIKKDESVEFHFNQKTEVTKFEFIQGISSANDVINEGVVEWYDDASKSWKQFGDGKINNSRVQSVIGYANTTKMRVRNRKDKNVWWRISEARAYGYEPRKNVKYSISSDNLVIATNSIINDWSNNNKLSYVLDGNRNTISWMSVTENGKRNQNIKANSNLVIDFDKSMQIEKIIVRQGDGDNISGIKIEGYENGEWIKIDEQSNAPREYTVDASKLTNHFTKIRVSSTKNTNSWWQLADVIIHEKRRPSKEYVIENPANNLLVQRSENNYKLVVQGNDAKTITLNKDQYVGIDLKTLEKIKEVSKNQINLNGAQLQTSLNGIVWENADSVDSIKNKIVRFIRIINNSETESSKSITLDSVVITTEDTLEFGKLAKTTFGQGINKWGDSRWNKAAFDGNIGSATKFGMVPKKGNYIIYDLGKEIDLRKLRIYARGNSLDFPRNIEVLYSTNLENNYTKLFDIPTVDDRNTRLDNVNSESIKVDSKYPAMRYFGHEQDLNQPVKARYIKLLVTKDYPNLSLVFNEIQINDGEYISIPNDPRFSGAEESSKNTTPSKMMDSDLSTYYEPKESNSEIKYFEHDPQPGKFIQFITTDKYSDATVTVKTANETGVVKEYQLGKLSIDNISFRIPEKESILEVKINWTDKKPQIKEMTLYDSDETSELNKEPLTKLTKLPSDFDNWVNEDKAKLNNLIEIAKKVLSYEHVTQKTLDKLVNNINSIIQNKRLKGDISKLQAEVNSEITDLEYYVESTTIEYKYSLAKAKNLIANSADETQDVIDLIYQELMDAKSKLRFSPKNKDELKIKVNDFEKLNPNRFLEENYQLLHEKVTKIKQKISDDDIASLTDKIHPKEFAKLISEYDELYKKLVDSEKGVKFNEYNKIKELANKFIDQNGSQWQNLSNKLNDKITEFDKQVNSDDSTIESINAAIEGLTKALNDSQTEKANKINKLKSIATTLIEDGQIYTEESFNKYLEVANKIKDLVANPDKILEEEIDSLIENMKTATDELQLKDQSNLDGIKQYAKSLAEKLENNKEEINNEIDQAQNLETIKVIIEKIKNQLIEESNNKIDKKRNEGIDLANQLLNKEKINEFIYDLNNANDIQSLENIINLIRNQIQETKEQLASKIRDNLTELENQQLKNSILDDVNNNLSSLSISKLNEYIEQIKREKENELIKNISKLRAQNNNLINQLESEKDSFTNRLQNSNTLDELKTLNNELREIVDKLISKYKTDANRELDKLINKENYATRIENTNNVNVLKDLIKEIQDKFKIQQEQLKQQKIAQIRSKIEQLDDQNLISALVDELGSIVELSQYDPFKQKVDQKIEELINTLKQKASNLLDKIENKEDITNDQIQQIDNLVQIRNLIALLEDKLQVQTQQKIQNKKLELLNKISTESELDAYKNNVNNSNTLEELSMIETQIDSKINEIQNKRVANNRNWIKSNLSQLNRFLELLSNQEIQNPIKNELNQEITNINSFDVTNIPDSDKETHQNLIVQLTTKANEILKSNLVTLPLLSIPLSKDVIRDNLEKIKESINSTMNESSKQLNIDQYQNIINQINNLNYDDSFLELIDQYTNLVRQYDQLWINLRITLINSQFNELETLKQEIEDLITKNNLTDEPELSELQSKIQLNSSSKIILSATTKLNTQKQLINELNNKVNSLIKQKEEQKTARTKRTRIIIGSVISGLVVIATVGLIILFKSKKGKK